MAHPDTGTWRAWLDDEAVVPDAERHLTECADCTRELTRLRDDRSYATTAVALLDAPAAAVDAPPAVPPPVVPDATVVPLRRRRSGRTRQWATSAAAALVAIAVLATPTGRVAAADFLSLFRSERVALLAVDEPSLETTAQALGRLGEAEDVQMAEPVEVANINQAIRRTGLPVTMPPSDALPRGFESMPAIHVTDVQQLRFTFREARTRAYLSEFGQAEQTLPDGYDGATLVVTIPAAVLQEYRGPDGMSGILVGHAGRVTAEVDGDIDLDTLRTFLLDLPGLPESVVQQLTDIDDWRNTLPIPVPVDRMGGQETTVDGAPAILVQEAGLGSGLLWQRGGVVTGVAGSLDESELRAVVDSLRAP